MTMTTKKEVFQRYLPEYLKASKQRKQAILNTVCELTRLHRKAAIRKFRRLQMRDLSLREKRGRKVYYTKDVTFALKTVWDTANQPCGELLYPMINEYVTILKRDQMWEHSNVATKKLIEMKEHTVRRRVAEFLKAGRRRKGISATKPSHLKSIIPIFKGPWKHLPPGHGQIDTVAHCGNTLLGDFVYTVNYTDSATYWIISRAQWNKGQHSTLESMKSIQKRLPVKLLGIHPDTGSEFINWLTKDWCEFEHIEFTRSEPGKKNDNMYVEERNGHVVRKYLGYSRFDHPTLVPLINELYDILDDYLNHFQAVRRTLEKKRIGAKYKRRYEKKAKTPYQRVLDHPEVSEEIKTVLRKKHQQLNPLILKQQIDTLLEKIMKLHKIDHGSQISSR